jgi:hypothetical protein
VFGGKIPECVNRNTLYGDIDKGGFKIVNVNSKLIAVIKVGEARRAGFSTLPAVFYSTTPLVCFLIGV